MKQRFSQVLQCAKKAAVDTIVTHDGIEHAGYLAFMGLLAVFPFLVFVVAILGTISSGTHTADYLTTLFHQLPPEVATALTPHIQEIISGPPQGLLTIAIIGAIWTASSAVEGLRTILNRAYRVHTPPHYFLRRGLSILHMLVFAFALIVGMALMLTLPALIDGILQRVPLPALFSKEAQIWGGLISVFFHALLLGVVAWIYYAIPNLKQHAVSVWPGALVVVGLWIASSKVLTFYLIHANQTLIYGSLGGIIAALLFFYISNIILIFGAEFNYHLSELTGMEHVEREG
jgi:membrane protein